MSDRLHVLMVAEKPSIAQAVASALAQGPVQKRKGVSPSVPVYEYDGTFYAGADSWPNSRFRVTSTVGHMWSLDFTKSINDNQALDPIELYTAPTVHLEDPRPRMTEHLQAEATGCHVLVLWLYCDREVENICFEVITTCAHCLHDVTVPGAFSATAGSANVFRARFSSLATDDLRSAFRTLAHPNQNEAAAVDARQEIDLKLGISFSRFQTKFFRHHFGKLLGKLSVTFGPCQTPTLWFCAHRHDQIAAFVPTAYWTVEGTVTVGGYELRAASPRGRMWAEAEAAAAVAATAGAAAATVAAPPTVARRCSRGRCRSTRSRC